MYYIKISLCYYIVCNKCNKKYMNAKKTLVRPKVIIRVNINMYLLLHIFIQIYLKLTLPNSLFQFGWLSNHTTPHIYIPVNEGKHKQYPSNIYSSLLCFEKGINKLHRYSRATRSLSVYSRTLLNPPALIVYKQFAYSLSLERVAPKA